MSALLIIREETASGTLLRSFTLRLPTACTTIRDVITERVRQQLAERPAIAVDAQIVHALAEFERNGFIVLVGDHQAESLDEAFLIQPDTQVSFVKLVPLVGG